MRENMTALFMFIALCCGFLQADTGTVKFFNDNKGYGFIVADNGEDVFVHISAVRAAGLSTLLEGDYIRYDLTINKNGKSTAKNIELME